MPAPAAPPKHICDEARPFRDLPVGARCNIANGVLVTSVQVRPMTKWVDNGEYFGPDRRQRSRSKLFNERRRRDETGELPPLGALLRRLRVQMVSLTPETCPHALRLLAGAISEANRLDYRQCLAALYNADRVLRANGASAATAADTHLLTAMEHAGQRR